MKSKAQVIFLKSSVLVIQMILSFYCFSEVRDPTAPFYKAGHDVDLSNIKRTGSNLKVKNGLTLSEIYIGSTKSVAIINGKQYRVKDSIQGYKVTEIKFNKVALSSSAGVKWLSLYPENKSGFNFR